MKFKFPIIVMFFSITLFFVFFFPFLLNAAEVGVSLYHDFNYLQEHPLLVDRIEDANIKWIKIELRMDQIEPEKGVFDFPSDEIALLHERGFKIFASLSYAPSWANGGQSRYHPCKNTADWYNFVSAVVQKFNDEIDYWGIWNEPGSTKFFKCDTDDCVSTYVNNVLLIAAQAIRAQDGTNFIVAPQTNYENWGELNPRGNNGVLFLKQVMVKLRDMNKLDMVDIISHHIFKVYEKGYWTNFISYMQDTGLRQVIETYGKPFWVGDFGWQVTPDQQAKQAKKFVDGIYDILHFCSAERCFIYMLNDNQYIGEYFGMIYDGIPYTRKKHYYTVRDYQEPQRENLKFEFETDFLHFIGRPNQTGWEASTSLDNEGYLAYGPYTTAVKGGYREAVFTITIDNNTVDNELIAQIEVSDSDYSKPTSDIGKVIALKKLYRKDFSKANSPVKFSLPFFHVGGEDRLEFRVYWFDKAYLSIDCVDIPGFDEQQSIPVLRKYVSKHPVP